MLNVLTQCIPCTLCRLFLRTRSIRWLPRVSSGSKAGPEGNQCSVAAAERVTSAAWQPLKVTGAAGRHRHSSIIPTECFLWKINLKITKLGGTSWPRGQRPKKNIYIYIQNEYPLAVQCSCRSHRVHCHRVHCHTTPVTPPTYDPTTPPTYASTSVSHHSDTAHQCFNFWC